MGCSLATIKTVTVSPYTAPIPATPGAPTLISYGTPTGPQGGSVTFGWNAVPGATSYEIYHSGAPQTAGVTVNGTQATVTGLYAPGTVSFGVVALNSTGDSAEGPTTTFTIPSYTAPIPATPTFTTFTATGPDANGNSTVTAAWTSSSGATSYTLTVNSQTVYQGSNLSWTGTVNVGVSTTSVTGTIEACN